MTPPLDDVPDQLATATRRLLRSVDALSATDYLAPSLLPGWNRAHVVAHLALNAEALSECLRGVVNGEKVPMYSSGDARDDDIAVLGGATPAVLRTRLFGSGTDLAVAITGVPDDALDTTIERTPGSDRTLTAGEVGWMRLREVEIHHVDLGVGYDRTTWEPAFTEPLVASLSRRGFATGFTVSADDLARTWQCGGGGPTVSGSAADLGWWLSGRGTGEGLTSDGVLPRIEEW